MKKINFIPAKTRKQGDDPHGPGLASQESASHLHKTSVWESSFSQASNHHKLAWIPANSELLG